MEGRRRRWRVGGRERERGESRGIWDVHCSVCGLWNLTL